jgi:DnaJ domain
MADHYRVLGVAPRAGHEEIKRAYTERALQVHPDRLVGASPDEIERAHFKMGELNAAWEVLRDPERRAQYDAATGVVGDTLVATEPHPGAPRIGAAYSHRPTGIPYRPAGVPDLEPEVEAQPTVVQKRRWTSHGPVLVVIALVLLVAIAGCIATVSSDPAPTKFETTERFPVGSCVVVQQDDTVTEASCRLVGARRVVGREPFPRPCPTGTEAIVLIEEDSSLCVQRG